MTGGILVVGDVMEDVVVLAEGPVVRGSDRRARITRLPGGSGANQAVWLGAMGAGVRFAGRVAAGEAGRWRAHFARFGVAAMLAEDAQAGPGVLVTLLEKDGERSFLTDRGANLNLCAADLPDSLLEGVGLVMVSGYSLFAEGPRAAVRDLLARAMARGIGFAVDAASRGFLNEVGGAAFLAWTDGAQLLFANAEEAELLAGSADPDMQVRRLGARCGTAIVKRGAEGAVLGGADGIRLALAAPAVFVRDSTGAGDAFAAGFVAALLAGCGEAEALARAIAAGARAVGVLGGQPEAMERER